ncbi:MAG: hypothetical protein ACI399_08065 [Candidatus Cryptobacteroides sp.]
MKRILGYFLSVITAVAALSACNEKYVPDGTAALQSFKLTASLNPSLASDIVGTIDQDARTVTLVIPESVSVNSFIPTFTVTADDVVTASGVTIESGVTSITVTDGLRIVVSDDKSSLSATYTIITVGNDERAELLDIRITSEDNPELIAEDITTEISEEMIARVPASAFRQELTIRLTATSNDEITVNGSAITDGKALNVDTAFPVDITVTDGIAGKSSRYVLKVGKRLEMVYELIATYSNEELDDYVDLAVDAANDVPYLVVGENSTVDGTTTKSMATVLKYDGAALVPVGERRFSGAQTSYDCIDVIDGKPYVAFVDAGAPVKSRISCMSFDGSSWNFVGERGFGGKITGLSYYRFDMILDPVTKYPITASGTIEAINLVAKRDLSISIFNGSAWEANIPVTGRTQTYCYNQRFARSADAVYLLAANQSDKTFSLYQYKDKSWSTLQNELVIQGTTDICTMFADLDVAPDGTIYATVGDNSSGNYLCTFYKYNGTELVKAWNALPGVTFDDKYCQWNLTFDSAGLPVIACILTNSSADTRVVKLFTLDPETKDWNSPVEIGSACGCYLASGRADNGNIYFVYSSKDANGCNVINLYKYCLEADILPE